MKDRDMELTKSQQNFIVHWGEMGTRWGINRTVAQIHGLLFISPEPLNAEEITELLQIARSNVSASLKELKNWELIKVVHKFGDRREYFEAFKEVWEVTGLILDQRKKREIDPTVQILEDSIRDCGPEGGEDDYSKKKMEELLSFFETMSAWYDQVRRLPVDKVLKFVEIKKKLKV